MSLNYFSMFSGIGGFEYGIEQAWNNSNRWISNREPKNKLQSDKKGISQQGYKSNSDSWDGYGGRNYPKCVGYSEINKYASAIYRYHYPNHKNYGNAKELVPEQLPDFNLLVGGFPCQAFSIAGKRQGFKDTRGTLFFDVARVLKAKRPEWLLLENVKGLCSHEGGETLATIYGVLTDLGYTVGWEVVNSVQFGVPQNRERIFIVGHLTEAGGRTGEILPVGKNKKSFDGKSRWLQRNLRTSQKKQQRNSQVPDKAVSQDGKNRSICARAVLTPDRLEKRQNGRRFKENEEPSFTLTSQDKHGVQIGTKIRRLTPIECERLQGFPDNWAKYGIIDGEKVKISDTQRYKALGNAVTTNVVGSFASNLFEQAEKS